MGVVSGIGSWIMRYPDGEHSPLLLQIYRPIGITYYRLALYNHCFTVALSECTRGVMVKAMDCGIVVSEFELQSLHYVHFRTNTLGKVKNPLSLSAMG